MVVKEYRLGQKVDNYLAQDNHLILLTGKLLYVNSSDSKLFDTPQIINQNKEYFSSSDEFFIPIENTQIAVVPKEENKSTKSNKVTVDSKNDKALYQNHTSLAQTESDYPTIKQDYFDFLISKTKQHSLLDVVKITLQNEQAKVLRNEITQHTYRMTYSRISKHIVPFFKNYMVESIAYEDINRFYNHLSLEGYSAITLSQYLVALKKVLETAKAHSWINEVPYIPKVKVQKKARGWFTLSEYKTLYKESIKLSLFHTVITPPSHRNKRDGIFTNQQNLIIGLNWVIRFMVNSFIRPVDLKIIQHQHIEIVKGKYTYLRLNLPETKRHIGQIITLPGAVFAYQSLVKYYKQFNLAKPSDYLFLPEINDRQAAITILENNFRKLLIHCNLRVSTNGLKRTLYSLRHSAITYRLLYGKKTDLLTLARNARTSIDMIDKYYASEVSAEMKIEHIHS